MVTENSNSCQNHRHHHKHHRRHHHKHHGRHGRCRRYRETNVCKRLNAGASNGDVGGSTEEDAQGREVWGKNECVNKPERKQNAGRVLRSRGYRRPFEDHRHTKRLFTPEIKRFLKSWLVRRRDNPYPSRDEKKELALQTGLTYIQICNWFANWRRKLKNAGSEAPHHTWGNLIKCYNTKAQGNVEQFSLCSDDSIWEEQDVSDREQDETDGVTSNVAAPLNYVINATAMDHSYSALYHHQNTQTSSGAEPTENVNPEHTSQNYHNERCLSLTVWTEQAEMMGTVKERYNVPSNHISYNISKEYKNVITEKCLIDLRRCQESSFESDITVQQVDTESSQQERNLYTNIESERVEFEQHRTDDNIYSDTAYSSVTKSDVVKKGCGKLNRKYKRKKKEETHPLELSKWLESAAKFKPGQNYFAWPAKNTIWQTGGCEMKKLHQWNVAATDEENYWTGGQHQRELDAAEALTRLSALQQ